MRAIAALLVATIHVSETFAGSASSGQWLHHLADRLNFGGIGVSLFFLVSGFVIPASLGDGGDRATGLRTFAIRRFFRLYPAYWLSIALALLVIWWLRGKGIEPGMVLANLTMLQRPLGVPNILGLYWTLLVELIFYAACAGLYAVGLLHRPRALVAALILLTVWFALQEGLGLRSTSRDLSSLNDLPVYLGLMFTGALLRFWHDGKPLERWVKSVLVAILAVFILPIARGVKLDEGQLLFNFNSDSGRAVAVMFFLLFAMRFRLAHPVLGWLGAISYSLYLFHPVAAQFWRWVTDRPGFELLQGWDLGASLALVVALTTVVASIAYRFVERPMIALGRRLSRPAASPADIRPAETHA